MNKEAVFHQYSFNYTYPLDSKRMLVKIRLQKGDARRVILQTIDKYRFNKGSREWIPVEMVRVATDTFFDFYEAAVLFNVISMSYYFEIHSGSEVYYYGGHSFFDDPEEPVRFNIPVLAEDDLFVVPDWAHDAAVYQIFPDRFYRSGNTGDRKLDPWNKPVGSHSHLGGNIRGIIDKLEYIKDLGVNTIYLTPIFKSKSNHKYDIEDYYEVDPDFGTKEDLRELVETCHREGLRVVFDAVFNHCSINFFAFRDVIENGEKSRYKDWFDIESFPVDTGVKPNYRTFGHYHKMPKLIQKNQDTAEYFLDVAEYWVNELDIDGWRFDVADEVSHSFWRKLRDRLKKVKPDILLIAEVWYLSVPWLNGDQFDTVMNYHFLWASADYFAKRKITREEFAARLGHLRGEYRIQPYRILWNLIGSHDTTRFLTECKDDKKRMKPAVLFQLLSIGTPMIYYGDEIGMNGEIDPHNREGMKWDAIDGEMLGYYRKILALRQKYPALRRGGQLEIDPASYGDGGSVFGFRRVFEGTEVLVAVNNSDDDGTLQLQGNYRDILNEEDFSGTVSMPPASGRVLIAMPV